MATGQPGFADSMFKLASQRQAALSAEQARVSHQETIRRHDINTLSGFEAASIEGDEQRAIFEEAVADVQSYITGTGEYEDAEYDPVNFKKQLMKISSLYNGFKAHNAGDVSVKKESLREDAYTEGGVEIGRENGTVLISNNSPTSFDTAVNAHNNYFETARTADGRVMYDENGHPMGYPVIDGEVDRSAAPVSLFKMEAYANPEGFRGEHVEQNVPSLYDMSVDAQAEIQNKQNIVGPNGLQTLREVSDAHFDNAINDFNFLDGAIRDRNRASENSIEITDEEMRAYAAGELDSEKVKILDKYKADAKEEWAKLTAYGRTGSGSDSPFTGSTSEYTLPITTESDAASAGGPNVDVDGNTMELVDPAYNVSNVVLGINTLEVTSQEHGNYQITGITQTDQSGELGGGQFVMIPSETEMIKMPDGQGGIMMIPYDTATAEQQNYAEAEQPGYTIVDVPDNEMIRIDGPDADPRAGEIWRNLRDNGITEADFNRNGVENVERFETMQAEREEERLAEEELQRELDATEATPQENTEVGTGSRITTQSVTDADTAATDAAQIAAAAAEAAAAAVNDDSVSDADTAAAQATATQAQDDADIAQAQARVVATAAASTAALADADAAAADAELLASEAAEAEEAAAQLTTDIEARSNRSNLPSTPAGGVAGLLKNLMEIGPRATYDAWRAGRDTAEQEEAEAAERERLLGLETQLTQEQADQTAAEAAERERLLALEQEMISERESLERDPGVREEAVSDAISSMHQVVPEGENLWGSPYGEPGNVAQILDPNSANYKEELQGAIASYGYPPENSPHRLMADAILDQTEFGPSQYPTIRERAPGDVLLERSGPALAGESNVIKMTSAQSYMVDSLVASGMSEQAAIAITSVSEKESKGDHTSTEISYVNTGSIPKREKNGKKVNVFSGLKSVTEEEWDKQRSKGKEEFDNWFWEKVYGKDSEKGKVLGNDEPGDGQKFRGRGLIQLTGKSNYRAASQAIYGDDRLLQNPGLISEDPQVAGQVAAWFITKSGKLKNIEYLNSEEITPDQARALADSAYAIVAGGVPIESLPGRRLYAEGIEKQIKWLNLN